MSPDLHHLSGAYAVDALDEGERLGFEQHLAGCAECRAEVAELASAAHALTALTEATPPPELRAAVLSGIGQVRPMAPVVGDDGPQEEHRRSEAVVPLHRRASTWIAAAAAAVVLAVAGLAWGPWSDPVETSPLAQVQSADDAAIVSATSGEVTAQVTYSRRLGRAAFAVDGLPPAPEGRTYQLWYVGTDEVPRPAGFLTPAADGTGELLLEGDANSAAAVGMTVEPVGGSERPTTEPVVVLALA